MVLPKKGLRTIVVDGEAYVWLIRKRPTYTQSLENGTMTAAVELRCESRAVLIIRFPFLRPDSAMNLTPTAVTPAMIQSSIRAARALGWEPRKGRGTFELKYDARSERCGGVGSGIAE